MSQPKPDLFIKPLKLLNWQERPLLNVSQTNLLLNKLQELSLARLRPDFVEMLDRQVVKSDTATIKVGKKGKYTHVDIAAIREEFYVASFIFRRLNIQCFY